MSCGCEKDTGILTQNPAIMAIEFLYLDAKVCEPCNGTALALDQAIAAMSEPFEHLNIEIVQKNIHVNSKAIAKSERLIASPTIRINGLDIDPAVTQDDCPTCGSIIGDDNQVNCRTWHWNEQVFNAAPVGKIIEAMAKAATVNNGACCGDACCDPDQAEPSYSLPTNLERFFDARINGCS